MPFHLPLLCKRRSKTDPGAVDLTQSYGAPVMWMGVFMLVGEMALEIRLLAKRGKGLRAIAREV